MTSFLNPNPTASNQWGIDGDASGRLWLTEVITNQVYLVQSGETLWVGKAPSYGTTAGLGATTTVTVTLDTVKAGIGDHRASLHFSSNAPATPDVVVSVRFQVTTLGDVTVPLAAGYNLIALPVIPTALLTAEGLAQKINADGGACTSVIAYEAGAFVTHPAGTAVNNFNVEVGKGYFVRCSTPSVWKANGYGFVARDNLVPLTAGYNLVGLPLAPDPAGKYTAESAGQEMNAQGGGVTQVVDYDPSTGQFVTHPVGTAVSNFTLGLGRGYFVRCTKGSVWTVSR